MQEPVTHTLENLQAEIVTVNANGKSPFGDQTPGATRIPAGPPIARRNHLPDERISVTHHFSVAGHDAYITVGLYPNGEPGELFITMAKEGSTVSGLINSFAQAVSIALQHGAPLKLLCDKFSFTRFEPSGWTGNQDIPQASSVMDYIFRWLEKKFLSGAGSSAKSIATEPKVAQG